MIFLIAVILLVFLSAIYHLFMLKVEAKKYKPAGKLFEIDGHKMHITGNGEGTPVVIMTCGSGAPSAYTEYCNIEPQLSKITRTCIYERPGYGWSEPASTPRHTEQIVEDLHRLLEKAQEKPPYILVAHSLGAMEAILYTHKYPEEVAGIVIIDGTSPYKHINYLESSIPIVFLYLLRVINNLGLIRIVSELELIPLLNRRLSAMPKDIGPVEKAMIYRNISNKMIIKEGDSLKEVAEKMYKVLSLNDIPLILLASDHSMKNLPGWEKSQNNLLELSRHSKLEIINGPNHISILQEHSTKIVKEIELIINTIRQEHKSMI
ncbi:alpha/beta hydrolase [Geosporobacter ferrireducens]|uniref:alpha/beta hydrolase n=1 Tax=Geosporobacter ferrireducens TaxID=1424294 RepID=UPI00139DC83D|nr:alpha/beta hydrolase [Geosporobacter ferrireducens]MTI56249.1 alpha/beta hydrolase [Geosporobacter ferrireducens]